MNAVTFLQVRRRLRTASSLAPRHRAAITRVVPPLLCLATPGCLEVGALCLPKAFNQAVCRQCTCVEVFVVVVVLVLVGRRRE